MTSAFASIRDYRPHPPHQAAAERPLAVARGTRVTVRRGILLSDLWIVGEEDADSRLRRVAAESSLGRALLGARVGEAVEYQVGGRVEEISILAIAAA